MLGIGFAFLTLLARSNVPPQFPSPVTVAIAADIGITPNALVIAGLDALQVPSVLGQLAGSAEPIAALSAAKTALDASGALLTQREEELWKTPGNQEAVAARDAAQAALESAATASDAARAALRAAALGAFQPAVVNSVVTFEGASTRSVPPEFAVLTKTPEEWTLVEVALRAEARAARIGTELDPSQAALLTEIRTNAAVAAANAALASGAFAMEVAFGPPN